MSVNQKMGQKKQDIWSKIRTFDEPESQNYQVKSNLVHKNTVIMVKKKQAHDSYSRKFEPKTGTVPLKVGQLESMMPILMSFRILQTCLYTEAIIIFI